MNLLIQKQSISKGISCVLLAQFIWGLGPVYFKQLALISPWEITAHRVIWSFCTLLILSFLLNHGNHLKTIFADKSNYYRFPLCGVLLVVNWFTYIWGVSTNHTADIGLGYFLMPILNVFFGSLFLKEKLSAAQKIAVFFAILGVLYQVIIIAVIPWISLVLALSFSSYALLKKQRALPPVSALLIETGTMLLPAVIMLIWLAGKQTAGFGFDNFKVSVMLIFSGIVTSTPFLAFITAARYLTLSTLGIMHLCAPSIMLVLSIWVYHEPIRQGIPSIILIFAAQLIYIYSLIRPSARGK